MSYIEIEIGGKVRGIKFTKFAMILINKKANLENWAATANYAMVYAGLFANNYHKEVENDFTFEDVCDWVDELDGETITKIDACLQSANAYKATIEASKIVIETDKKKLKKPPVKKAK